MRHDRLLKYNLEGRLLGDILGSEPGGFFVAFIHGKRYNGKELSPQERSRLFRNASETWRRRASG
jgi:hypothetical protein